MCQDLQPVIDRSEMMHYDLKGLQIGLFVMFFDLIPIPDRHCVTECGPKGPKIGKKVMCRDLRPIRDRSEVMFNHFEPADDTSEATSAFSAASPWAERLVGRILFLFG